MTSGVRAHPATPTHTDAAHGDGRSPWSTNCTQRQRAADGGSRRAAHVGDIQGAFGTIREHDLAARRSWWKKLLTLLAIIGPGLIVMVGDNDAGGVSTYAAGGPELRA